MDVSRFGNSAWAVHWFFPYCRGSELAENISVALPGIKVMFVSGNIDSKFIHGPEGGGTRTLLSKPFELRVLAGTLRDLLDTKTQ